MVMAMAMAMAMADRRKEGVTDTAGVAEERG